MPRLPCRQASARVASQQTVFSVPRPQRGIAGVGHRSSRCYAISKQLDKVVRYRFGDNAELMGAWESARKVAGPFQTKNEPESGAGGSEAPKAA